MKILLWIAIGLVVGAGLVSILVFKPTENNLQKTASSQQTATPSTTPQTTSSPSVQPSELSSGRYTAYTNTALSEKNYTKTILFFHAPWCPECRAFEQAIKTSTIPDGVQILKVDYDSSSDLKSKYGVTLQSTFVSVDESGQKIASWVGYGKNKSVETILSNL